MQSPDQLMAQLQQELQQERDRRRQAEAALAASQLINAQLQQALNDQQTVLQDHERLERELLDSQQRLEAFFSQSLDGFFFMMIDQPIRWDEHTDREAVLDYVFHHQHITQVNGAMLQQYGATAADFLGLTPNDFFAHDLATGRQLWQQMFDQGSLHTETQEQKFDGTPMWIDGDYICLYSPSGEIIGHFGIQREITDRKQAEAELERFNQALSYAMEGISCIDRQGHYVQVNQAYANAVGYSPEAMIGMDWQPTVHPDDLEAVKRAYQQMLEQGKVEVEARGVRRDGTIFYKQLVMITVYDMQQQMTGHYCFMKDISDRKASELALQVSEQRYVTLAQAVPVGIFRTDPNGYCLYVNDRWCQMTGLTAASAQQDGWAQTLHPADRDRVLAEWYDCAQQNLPFQSEYRFQKPNGDIIWVIGQAIAEYGHEGELIGYVGSITDISAAKRAELIRQQVEADLQQSEQKFRAVFDHMFQLIGILTPDGSVIEANRTALDVIGMSLSDVVGQPFWDTPWWTHSPQLQRQLKTAIVRAAAGELVRFEAEHILADGSSIFVDFSMKPVWDETGTVVMLIPEGRDVNDRKQVEIQLRQQEAFLKSIYDGTEQAIFVINVGLAGELRYASFNPVSARYAGVTQAQIQDRTPEEAFGADLGAALRQNYERCLEAGTSIVYEERLDFAAHVIWTLTTLVPLRDQSDRIYRIIGTATDITDRKQIEEALRASEQRLQALLDNSTTVIYMKDTQGRYMLMNRSYEVLFHLDRNQVKGKTDHDIFPPVIADAFQLNDREVIAAGVAIEKEEVAPQDDGLHTYISIKFPLFDANGKIYAVCGMSTDISDRKRQEEILQNIALGVSAKTGAAFFQALVEYLTKALGVEFAFISELTPPERQTIRTIAGYGDDQAIAHYDYELKDTPCEQIIFNQQLCVYPSQIQQQFPQDTYLRTIAAESYMGLPLLDASGQILGLLTVISRQPIQDPDFMAHILTIFAARAAAELERQQAETVLKQQKQDLARSNAELQQFAYVASHDLQEPLRMVTSYLELLERRYKGQLDAKADQFIDYAVDGAVRMQTLINALLSYSRIGSKDQPFQPVNCEIMLADVLTNLQVTIDQNQAIITHDPLPSVSGDRTQLAQLFQNLISNGIKFRQADAPQIHIAAQRISDKWLFSIRDNGIGIESQYVDRIFIIFQRLHSRAEYPGTGIGLAICKKIVERHGGKLWVESQPNQGAIFYFTLPCMP
jgi:PAS domain S-box-containing protein